MTPTEVLTRVHELISQGWCKFTHAKTASGKSCHPESVLARCWCIRGAFLRVVGEQHECLPNEWPSEYLAAQKALEAAIGHNRLSTWNDYDCNTQAEVLSTINLAKEHLNGQVVQTS